MSDPRTRYELIERAETPAAASVDNHFENISSAVPDSSNTLDESQAVLLPTTEAKVGSNQHRWRASTFAIASAGANGEVRKIALSRDLSQLALSFTVHLIPITMTVAIVQLSFRSVYGFDVEDNTTNTIRISRWAIGLNEYLNTLQFAAKIHEILMVASLSAIILHFVRRYLVSLKGLPFGLLTAGYLVGSAEYIASKAFWGSGLNRMFWFFSGCMVFCTVLANILGPSSAIALIPNLDWWELSTPFSGQALPVGFKDTQSEQWPLKVSAAQAISPNVNVYSEAACTSTGFLDLRFCPAAGYNELTNFAKAYGNQDVPSKITIIDYPTSAKRLVESVLVKGTKESNVVVAISTSISHSFAVVLSSFPQFVKTRSFNMNDVTRPKFELKKGQAVFQPLVQVQCQPMLLPEFAYFHPNTSIRRRTNSTDINTFSKTENLVQHGWDIPEWVYHYKYNVTENVEKNPNATSYANMVNVTWVDMTDHHNASASIGAIVLTPLVGCDKTKTNCTQMAHVHTCTVDARWIGSSPSLDPISNSWIQHNISDLLLFQKSNTKSTTTGEYGISSRVNIDSSWGAFLNTQIDYDNPYKPNTSITAGALEWIISTFITPVPIADPKTNENINLYDFSPAFNLANNQSALETVESVGLASSDTIATILSLSITDGLARIGSAHDWFVALENDSLGNKTAVNLGHFIGSQLYLVGQSNATLSEWTEAFPYQLLLQVERYGYGYGLGSVTVRFGVTIILMHTVIAVGFMMWSVYDYLWKGGWTSKSWSSMGEMAALLINSEKAPELQNTCAGVKKASTWRQRIRVREVGEEHLGVAFGKGSGASMGLGQVMVKRKYGRVEQDTTL